MADRQKGTHIRQLKPFQERNYCILDKADIEEGVSRESVDKDVESSSVSHTYGGR